MDIETEKTKKCSTCNKTLEYSMFAKNKNTKDGYAFSCKKCKGATAERGK